MERLFGSERQSKMLVLIGMLESTFPRELAALSDCSLTTALAYLDKLEEDGIIVSIREGKNRRVTINPRYKARQELVALLKKLGERNAEVQSALATLRRRPRRTRKALWQRTSE